MAVDAHWNKSEVIPVVLVKPGIAGFEPAEGSSIGNYWSKQQVKPVLLVKPGIGGFEPREGSTIGNQWQKADVLPVMLVEPSIGGFIPLKMLQEGLTTLEVSPGSTTSQQSLIESQIDGDFDGWEGETIIKLMNGQIWQQSEYYYHYHYAFMPKVTIFKTSLGYKMKIAGVDRAVGVTRLK